MQLHSEVILLDEIRDKEYVVAVGEQGMVVGFDEHASTVSVEFSLDIYGVVVVSLDQSHIRELKFGR